jgi:hypothetical protein
MKVSRESRLSLRLVEQDRDEHTPSGERELVTRARKLDLVSLRGSGHEDALGSMIKVIHPARVASAAHTVHLEIGTFSPPLCVELASRLVTCVDVANHVRGGHEVANPSGSEDVRVRRRGDAVEDAT